MVSNQVFDDIDAYDVSDSYHPINIAHESLAPTMHAHFRTVKWRQLHIISLSSLHPNTFAPN